MSAKDLPWFPFYVDRFMGSRKTRTMDAQQVGIYLLLLCEQWDNGFVPNDREEIEDIARAPYDNAMAVLSRCFGLLEGGWVNDALEEIRAIQEAKSKAKSRAGKVGAEKRWGKKKKRQSHSTAMPTHSNREEKIREEKRREDEKETTTLATLGSANGANGNGGWNGGAVLDLFVQYCRKQGWPDPPRSQMGKLGAAAKRLSANDRETMIRAMVGMGMLFPHSDGHPWDLMDLEKKLTKASAAAMEHPKIKERAFRAAFLGGDE